MDKATLDNIPENFNGEQAKTALLEILCALTSGDGLVAVEGAREAVGNDMIGLMTQVFPVVTQIMIDVISKYGFSQDGVGAIQFEHTIKNLEEHDAEIARLHAQVRSYFLPAVVIPPATQTTADS